MVKGILRNYEPETCLDMSDAMVSRRIQVVEQTADEIVERYKDYCTENMNKNDMGVNWARTNFFPHLTYNTLEVKSHILCAAAIWILDQVTQQEDWQLRLYPILPQDEIELPDMYAPDLWDTDYENELIKSVLYVLYYRDRDIGPLEKDDEYTVRVITTSLNASNAQHQDVPSRRAFNALMDLIPQEAKEHAAQHFTELFSAWADRYCTCFGIINAELDNEVEKLNSIAREYNELREVLKQSLIEIANGRPPLPQKDAPAAPKFNPLLANPAAAFTDQMDSFLPTGTPSDRFTPAGINDFISHETARGEAAQLLSIVNKMVKLSKRHEALHDHFDDAVSRLGNFYADLLHRGCIPPDKCRRDYGDEVTEQMKPLAISDPYEICFALLWLVESGSDLPWLYGVGCGLMKEVTLCLPWGINDYDETEDPIWGIEDLDEVLGEESTGTPLSENEPEHMKGRPALTPDGIPSLIQDWYERRYGEDNEEKSSYRRSLAQILYEETGCLMPRNLHQYDSRLQALREYGVPMKETRTILYLFSALSHARRQYLAVNLSKDGIYDEFEGDDEFDDDEQNENSPDAVESLPTYEELKEQLNQSQEEIKRLRSFLHDAERAARDARNKLASEQAGARLEHRELADLRELIFNKDMEEGEEQEEPSLTEQPDSGIYPYAVRKDTVVFGGHENWLRTMRSLLKGDIRFIDKDLNFDTDIIRHADIIWIQTNAMSHKQYYRVIDAARNHHIQVRYFTNSSAAKSAAALVQFDKG